MEDGKGGDGLDLEERMPAPGHVGRESGRRVDDGDGERGSRGDSRQIEPEAQARTAGQVETEAAMRLLVAPALEQVSPVLRDEPDADPCDGAHPGRRMEQVEHEPQAEHRERGDPERDFVDSLSQDVDPRPERVLLDADQGAGRQP